MYSMVLVVAMTGAPSDPQCCFGWGKGHGCNGGCVGYSAPVPAAPVAPAPVAAPCPAPAPVAYTGCNGCNGGWGGPLGGKLGGMCRRVGRQLAGWLPRLGRGQ